MVKEKRYKIKRPRNPALADWARKLSELGGKVVDPGALPASLRQVALAGKWDDVATGFRLETAATRPDLLVGSQLLFWPVDESIPPPSVNPMKGRAEVWFENSLDACDRWDAPTVIISDGPYGLGSYPGDPPTPEGLAECYEPFVCKWYERALPSATLWFWNSEQGWANCHRMIEGSVSIPGRNQRGLFSLKGDTG